MIPAYGFIKLSVIYFYRRIFVRNTPDSRFNLITNITSVVIVIWSFVFFFMQIFRAGIPVSRNWGPLIEAKHGITGLTLNYGVFVSDFLTDVWVVFLPVPIVSTRLRQNINMILLTVFPTDFETSHVVAKESQYYRRPPFGLHV